MHIASNDADENPFDIHLEGFGYSASDDSDSDGLNDAAEFKLPLLGFHWDVDEMAAVEELMANAHLAGLFTENDIRDIWTGTPMVEVDNGMLGIDLQRKKSDDLINWENFGELIHREEPAEGNRFYRFHFVEPAGP